MVEWIARFKKGKSASRRTSSTHLEETDSTASDTQTTDKIFKDSNV